MSALYLSRLRIARSPQVAALAQLLNPAHTGQRMDAHHRLLWSAFAGDGAQKRDFLWREEGHQGFLVLSRRPPNASPLFETVDTREFTPALRPADRLSFLLRANATRTVTTGDLAPGGRPRKRHQDLVMQAIHALPQSRRAAERMFLAEQAARAWLSRQGSQHGFQLEELIVQDYSVQAIPGWVGQRRGQPQFGVLELAGTLTVVEPDALLNQIAHGFGRAKAFGCGLMLIRRS